MNYQGALHAGQVAPQAGHWNQSMQTHQNLPWNSGMPTTNPGQQVTLPSFQSISPQVRMPLQYQSPPGPFTRPQIQTMLPQTPLPQYSRPQIPLQQVQNGSPSQPLYRPMAQVPSGQGAPQVPVQPVKSSENEENENEVLEAMFNEVVEQVHQKCREQNLPYIHFHKAGDAHQENCKQM